MPVMDLKQLEHNVETYRGIHARAVQAGNDARMASQWLQQAQDTLTRAKALSQKAERAEHHEENLALDHRSGSAGNAWDLRQEVLKYLDSYGVPGDWVDRTDMCRTLNAWYRFTKFVVDATLAAMAAEGIIEAGKTIFGPRQIRLIVTPQSPAPSAPDEQDTSAYISYSDDPMDLLKD